MRLQLASDLHLEHLAYYFPGERLISAAPEADLLVLAGDIAGGARAIELFAQWPVPVLYVLGNHEFYGADWQSLREDLRRKAVGTSVVLLDNGVADLSVFTHWAASRQEALSKVRFLGCTMWTDYRLRTNRTQSHMMANAERRIADHSQIRVGERLFEAADALADHERSRAWLESELAKPFEGTTVVITHHGPHPMSVHPRYAGDITNAAFVSDLGDLFNKVDLWMHGHVHDSFDYKLGRCRVVANPRGYAYNKHSQLKAQDLQFENPGFEWAKLIDI
jgi:predicted phosphodiesterase